jgi:hypothetical protein
MAKIYAVPASVHVPDFGESLVNGRYDMQKDDQIIEKFYEELRTWLKSHGHTSGFAGEVIYLPWADGKAAYMVMSLRPCALIHLPIHDAWRVPDAHERGLNATDIKAYVEQRRAWATLGQKQQP